MKELLYCLYANNKIGLGHLKRALSISEVLKENFKITFLINNHNYSKNLISENGFSYIIKDRDCFSKIDSRFHISIVDYLNSKIKFIKDLRELNVETIVCLDDLSDAKFYADILIDSRISNKNREIFYRRKKIYKNSTLKEYFGLNYNVFSENIIKSKKISKINKKLKNVFICFGGTDPQQFTLKLLKFINTNEFKEIKFNFVITNSYKDINEIKKVSNNIDNVELHIDINNINEIIVRSDIGICASGNVLLEAMSLNLPCFSFAHNNAQVDNIGLVKDLVINSIEKNYKKLNFNEIRLFLSKENFELREKLYNNLKINIDNRGIYKIKSILEKL